MVTTMATTNAGKITTSNPTTTGESTTTSMVTTTKLNKDPIYPEVSTEPTSQQTGTTICKKAGCTFTTEGSTERTLRRTCTAEGTTAGITGIKGYNSKLKLHEIIKIQTPLHLQEIYVIL